MDSNLHIGLLRQPFRDEGVVNKLVIFSSTAAISMSNTKRSINKLVISPISHVLVQKVSLCVTVCGESFALFLYKKRLGS